MLTYFLAHENGACSARSCANANAMFRLEQGISLGSSRTGSLFANRRWVVGAGAVRAGTHLCFMRQPNTLGSIGYSIFAAVPFVYELRALLDWSCTATTLTLFDWLKLEDIHTSLFLVTCNRVSRERPQSRRPAATLPQVLPGKDLGDTYARPVASAYLHEWLLSEQSALVTRRPQYKLAAHRFYHLTLAMLVAMLILSRGDCPCT